MNKKLFWIKLNKDFFQDIRIKKIRSVAGGDTYTCIYLELLLLSLDDERVIFYEGIEPSIEEELSLKTGETLINIKAAMAIFESLGLLQRGENDDIRLPEVAKISDSECDSAERVRKFRAKAKEQKTLHCNNAVTQVKQPCNTDIDIDIEKEEEKELESEREQKACEHTHDTLTPAKEKSQFSFTLKNLPNFKTCLMNIKSG